MANDIGVLDGYHLGELFKVSARQFGERCGAAGIRLLAGRLGEALGAPDEDRYSYMWRPAVEEHEQNLGTHDYRTAVLQGLRDAALAVATGGRSDSTGAVQLLLRSPYPTVVRIGIHICSENYAAVGAQFWTAVKPAWFLEPVYWHEVYWLLKKNFLRFSASERGGFFKLAGELRGNWREGVNEQEWDERHRRDVLQAVAGLGDADVDFQYNELVGRWGGVREHPDFHSYHTTSWVGDVSPVTSDALVAMSDEELSKLLQNFVPEEPKWGREETSRRGLGAAISGAVRASTDGFKARIPLFAETHRAFQHGLIDGLRHRMADDRREIAWEAAFEVIKHIVSASAFAVDVAAANEKHWEPSVHWLVGDIADLFKAGTAADGPLPLRFHEDSIGVLERVLSVMPPTAANAVTDPVSHAINDPRGRCLEALINVALSMRRRASKDAQQTSETVWGLVGPILREELSSSSAGQNADFAAMLGMYCANLHYLNAEWVEGNFDLFFSKVSEAAWRCAADGFAYQTHVYDWMFKRLDEGGHLRRMLFTTGLSAHVSEKALQFLGVAYLEGLAELDGGLLGDLVSSVDVERLSQLCWFFWTMSGGVDSAASSRAQKVLSFWEAVAVVIKGHQDGFPELQSALNLLAAFVTELTGPTTAAWKEAAPYAQVKYNGHILVENLARLAPRFPLQVTEIFEAALSGFLPDFDAEDVIKCVGSIADAGHREEAERICNAYADRGSVILKETYEKLRGRARG
jgi:hypothetical protein